MRYLLIILSLFISNLIAFDFYGLKSGMSYEEVMDEYLKFDLKSYCLDQATYDKEHSSYSNKDKTIEELVENCEKNPMPAYLIDVPTDEEHLKSLKEKKYIYAVTYIENIDTLMQIPYIENIAFMFTPNNEALYGILVKFELDIQVLNKSNTISETAFNNVLEDKFPNAVFQKYEASPYTNGPQTGMILIDEELSVEWIEKYYKKINKF